MISPRASTATERVWLTTILFGAMGAATFTAGSVGIVATFIIDDLSIDRTQLGLVIAANSFLAALMSPLAGRVTDAIGGRWAVITVFAASSLCYLTFGLAVAAWVLFLASFFGAWAHAGANPSTNKLIVESMVHGERGIVTGIKQSGVQAAVFLGGLSLPSLAIALGWRGAFIVVALVPAVLALAAGWVVEGPAPGSRDVPRAAGPLPAAIWWLAGYGLLFGLAGAVTFLVPLFAEEELGFDPRLAGAAVAVIGLAAFFARIVWARRSEIRDDYRSPLVTMAVLAVAAALAMLAAPEAGSWLLWPGVVLIGLSTSAWNSVGMLAVMSEAGTAATGRASGLVLLGFLAGFGVGPPIYGALVDRVGYGAMWWLSAGVALATLALMAAWRATLRAVRD